MSPFRYGEPSETCPLCNGLLEAGESRWVKRDQGTWELVKETTCPGCQLSGYLVLRTLVQT